MNPWLNALLPCLAVAALIPVLADKPAPAAAPATAVSAVDSVIHEMAAAAKDFLAVLDAPQRSRAQFPFQDAERENWHFVPYDRKGLPLKDMRPDQQHLAYGLLATALSHEGFRKATQIMSLEQVLFEQENKAPHRDPARYFVSIFGTPSADGTWGWRFEGHHLATNFTIVQGKHLSVTPTFMGANPGEIATGPRQGLQVLGREDALGFELVNSLDAEQKQAAVIQEKAVEEVITHQEKRAKPLQPDGLAAAKMNAAQLAVLQKLVSEYVRRFRPELADADLAKIRSSGWEQVAFAWAGGFKPGEGHYYRIQGPAFLLEFANTQNHAHHPHAVWRDFANDFGEDILRRHYVEDHAK
ncbi:MAG: DUF3500 domain-containing protein [Verrucomicrobiales bacterium]|nr:DUF3500 domain-containing protein [Verrucomicrobiales bacterium]